MKLIANSRHDTHGSFLGFTTELLALATFCALVVYVSYGKVIAIPEEVNGLNLTGAWKDLFSSSSRVAGRPPNPNDLVAYPTFFLEYLIGRLNGTSYLITLWIRAFAISTSVFFTLIALRTRKAIALIMSIGACCSFTAVSSLTYWPKVAAALLSLGLFQLLIKAPTNLISPRWLLSVCLLVFMTTGVMANVPTALVAWMTPILAIPVASALSHKTHFSIRFATIVIVAIGFLAYLPAYFLAYNSDARSAISDLLQKNYFVPATSPLRTLAGGGYWAQYLSYEGAPYFPWAGKANSATTIMLIVLVILIIVVTLGCGLKGLREKKIDRRILGLLSIWVTIFYLLSAVSRKNIIWKSLDNQSHLFAAFREPWTKFSLLYWLYLLILVGFVLEANLKFPASTRSQSSWCKSEKSAVGPRWRQCLVVASSSSKVSKHLHFALLVLVCLLPLVHMMITVCSIHATMSKPHLQKVMGIPRLLTLNELTIELAGLSTVPLKGNKSVRETCLLVDSEAPGAAVAVVLAETAMNGRVSGPWKAQFGEKDLAYADCLQHSLVDKDLVVYDPNGKFWFLIDRCNQERWLTSQFMLFRGCE